MSLHNQESQSSTSEAKHSQPAEHFLTQEAYSYRNLDQDFILNPENWSLMRQEMGGKGWSLAVMTALGLQVPTGFTLPSRYGVEIADSAAALPVKIENLIHVMVGDLTNKHGAEFGSDDNPLLVAVRSGADVSMPGAMNSVLNIGVSWDTIDALAEHMGLVAAMESFHIFCFSWAAAKLAVSTNELEQEIREFRGSDDLTLEYRSAEWYAANIKTLEDYLWDRFRLSIPQDPWQQISSSVLAVYQSYNNPEAVWYRQQQAVQGKHNATAVNVLSMVHGNQGEVGGSGVAFSHDPKTGKPHLHIEYLPGRVAAVVDGTGTSFKQELNPMLQSQLEDVVGLLAELLGSAKQMQQIPVDVEFVIEDGQLYYVQFRSLSLALPAKLWLFMTDFLEKHQQLSQDEKLVALHEQLNAHLLVGLGTRFTDESLELSRINEQTAELPRLVATGQPIGGRAHVGQVVHSLEEARKVIDEGGNVVLIQQQLREASQILSLCSEPYQRIAVVALEGSPSSHAANVLGAESVAGVIGCRGLPEAALQEGAILSVDGLKGEIHLGQLNLAQFLVDENIKPWIEARRKMGVSAWDDVVEAFGSQEKRDQLTNQFNNIITAYMDGESVHSPKALTQEVITNLFPSEYQTTYHIVSLIDQKGRRRSAFRDEIRNEVELGWQGGYDVSVRSAYFFTHEGSQLGKNPWVVFKPGEEERLEAFLNGEMPDWKYGSIAEWLRAEEEGSILLTEVLVGFNHANKLDEEYAHQHAAGTLNCRLGQPKVLELSVYLDTPHLRSYEQEYYDPDQDIQCQIQLPQEQQNGELQLLLRVGQNHIDPAAVEQLIDKLISVKFTDSRSRLSAEERATRQELLTRMGIPRLDQWQPLDLDYQTLTTELVQMIERGQLPPIILEQVMDPRSWQRSIEFIDTAVKRFVPAIAPGLATVENWLSRQGNDTSGITIEIQAGYVNNFLKKGWIAIYGLKGLEEGLMALLASRYSG